MLLGGEQGQAYRESRQAEPEPPKPFMLPEAHTDMRRVFAYLVRTRCWIGMWSLRLPKRR